MHDDIRLIYIGTPHKAQAYAHGHVLPEPSADQILSVQHAEQLAGLTFPHWCHIAIELTTDTKFGTHAALNGAHGIFGAALVRREPPPRKANA